MKTFLLILTITNSYNFSAVTTVPTEYPTEAKCTEAGKVFAAKWDKASFACIPSGNAP